MWPHNAAWRASGADTGAVAAANAHEEEADAEQQVQHGQHDQDPNPGPLVPGDVRREAVAALVGDRRQLVVAQFVGVDLLDARGLVVHPPHVTPSAPGWNRDRAVSPGRGMVTVAPGENRRGER